MSYAKIEDLLGKTMVKVENKGNEELVFTTAKGKQYKLYHNQDCCESVLIEDICGNLDDLIGTPLMMSEEVSNENEPPPPEYADSFLWTFYKFATKNGYVTVRWLGESNGYYSESVDFAEIK